MKPKQYPPINPKFPHFLHGGDYNPEQWKDYPKIWDEDMRLMKLAGCNAMSVGIFAWTALEPAEGEFEFGWLDTIMDKLAENGAFAVLATPSGARPAWMAQKYPEVLRVAPNRQRNLYGVRHNHCYTSPVYREKCRTMNRKLAQRYQNHPALLVWHISNEYGGECHCDLCQQAFRDWLRAKFHDDLDRLNHDWWADFWSHTYTDWSQIESPAPHGENHLLGLSLEWKRFVSHQTIDFCKNEIQPLKELTPDIPVTTNFMGPYPGVNYWKFAEILDVVSWDSYPSWGNPAVPDWHLAAYFGFLHDLNRSLKNGKPFMLMESSPSSTNWQPVPRLKRPGMHRLASLQAVAHGADTVQYFQWRKSRGGWEKFHGAVVDHCGHENNRVFREVADLGMTLQQLDSVVGTSVPAEVALIFDWENRWALEGACGPHQTKKDYDPTCSRHYRAFWRQGIPVDVLSMDGDFSDYKILIAPMLYMVRPGVAARMEQFVARGGTLVTTYLSGIVDENDLCFLGGFPGPLRKLLGIWAEELDALYDDQFNTIKFSENTLGFSGEFRAEVFCDLIHAEGAEVLATFGNEFYTGRPAVTCNQFGSGSAYYLASRNEDAFLYDFYRKLAVRTKLTRTVEAEFPEGVTALRRTDGVHDFVFFMNFSDTPQFVELPESELIDIVSGTPVKEKIDLKAFDCRILRRGYVPLK